MKIWDECAWQRHLELVKTCGIYGSESGWSYYIETKKSEDGTLFPPEGSSVVFLNDETNVEFRQYMSQEQLRHLFFGNNLIRNMPFINWLGDL